MAYYSTLIYFQQLLIWFKSFWFFWLFLILVFLFWNLWLIRARTKFIKNLKWILLEIKIPRDIYKSPRAMELVFNSLYSTFGGSWSQRVLKGFLPNWYSLEIASFNGEVHFFIYTQESFRNFVESQIYAQYPDAEIEIVDDYVYQGRFEDLEEWNLWGVEFALTKPDPYPIRTYIDFGLHDIQAREEQKINPLVSFLELLGSLKEGEQIWFQILIKGAGKKWTEEAKKLIDELMGRKETSAGSASSEEKKEKKLTKGEQDVILALERNVSKLGFKTGIRAIYLARRDVFNPINIASILGIMNQYSIQNLNGFKPGKTVAPSPLPFLFKKFREKRNKLEMLNAYRFRSYFYWPYKRKPFVLSSEELATIYHFPGRVAVTPTLVRIEARKGEPPPTLPI